jgi:poly(3-hydroxyalkanoate) synthetase
MTLIRPTFNYLSALILSKEQDMTEMHQEAAKLDFDAWWILTENKIPGHHYKEIIQADFRARGLSSKETMQSYNEALKKYGLKLS